MSSFLTEAAIRPPDLMVRKQACITHDRDYLLQRRDQWVAVPCPACDESRCTSFGKKVGFEYVRCCACETIYTSPRPSDDLLKAFYLQSQNYAFWNDHIFPATEQVRRERIFRPRAECLAAILDDLKIKRESVLDVGAAFGTFCEEAQRRGVAPKAIALEPNPALAKTCRDRSFQVIDSSLETTTVTQIADVVTAFEVIEHVFNPRLFVQRCTQLLRPCGVLVLSCPNVLGFGIAQLGVKSPSFDHEHMNYFHPASLAHLVRACGLDICQVSTPGQLDADLVRQAALRGEVDLSTSPFLEQVLIHNWDNMGASFQAFLAANRLSSHLWLVARRVDVP